MGGSTGIERREGLRGFVFMERGEAADNSGERAQQPRPPEDEQIVFPAVLEDLLYFPEQGLEEGVFDGLRAQRLLQLEGQLHEARFIGTGDIPRVLEQPLVDHLLRQRAQPLLQLLVTRAPLRLTPRLPVGRQSVGETLAVRQQRIWGLRYYRWLFREHASIIY